MSVEHPNIVPLVGFTLQPPLALISPWYEGGNIAVHLRRHPEADRLKLVRKRQCLPVRRLTRLRDSYTTWPAVSSIYIHESQ